MRTLLLAAFAAAIPAAFAPSAQAFCGFFVGKADAGLFNQASQVILARDGAKITITMLNDYKGELAEFETGAMLAERLRRCGHRPP